MPELDIQRFCGDKTFQRYRKMIQLVKFQECAVCTESIHVSQFPEAGVTESCTHAPSTCLECIRHHIESQLETRMWNQLSCPECPALLGYADVRKYASKPTFERYDSLLMRDGISSDLNFRWCTAGCGSGQVHLEGSESPLMICNSCRALSCFTHQSPWHEGKTCVEFDNLEGAEDKPEGSSPREYGKLLSNLAEIVGPSRKIFVGGVKRKETDQERKDRKLAMRLSKEQEKEDKKRRQRIEQEDRNRVQAEEAGQQEAQRHAREVEEEREREEQKKNSVKLDGLDRRSKYEQDSKKKNLRAAPYFKQIQKHAPGTAAGG
ncbi:hypothetical protein MMC20_002075 [Loxospora ochrophaea]|nr:hypothetical protein [Loxospora ochrophaea]